MKIEFCKLVCKTFNEYVDICCGLFKEEYSFHVMFDEIYKLYCKNCRIVILIGKLVFLTFVIIAFCDDIKNCLTLCVFKVVFCTMSCCLRIDITFSDLFGHQFIVGDICVGFFENEILPLTTYSKTKFDDFDVFIHDKEFALSLIATLEGEGKYFLPPTFPDHKRRIVRSVKITYGTYFVAQKKRKQQQVATF